jgi:hypothetical protein
MRYAAAPRNTMPLREDRGLRHNGGPINEIGTVKYLGARPIAYAMEAPRPKYRYERRGDGMVDRTG